MLIQKLKEAIINNWPLKIAAFMTTTVIFFIVHGDNPTAITTTIPIRVTIPNEMVLSEPLPDRARITISGTRALLKDFNADDMPPVVLKVNRNEPTSVLTIPTNQIELPTGLRVSSVQPEFLRIQIEPKMTKTVPVEARLVGTPAVEYAVKKVTEVPDKITLNGPKRSLDAISHLFTEPISLNEIHNTITKKVHVRLDDPLVSFVTPPIVNVTIETITMRGQKTFEHIPIIPLNLSRNVKITPNALSIEVSGPKGLIDAIEPNNLKAVVNLSKLENQPPQTASEKPTILNLPDHIDIESISPGVVLIETLPTKEKETTKNEVTKKGGQPIKEPS